MTGDISSLWHWGIFQRTFYQCQYVGPLAFFHLKFRYDGSKLAEKLLSRTFDCAIGTRTVGQSKIIWNFQSFRNPADCIIRKMYRSIGHELFRNTKGSGTVDYNASSIVGSGVGKFREPFIVQVVVPGHKDVFYPVENSVVNCINSFGDV